MLAAQRARAHVLRSEPLRGPRGVRERESYTEKARIRPVGEPDRRESREGKACVKELLSRVDVVGGPRRPFPERGRVATDWRPPARKMPGVRCGEPSKSSLFSSLGARPCRHERGSSCSRSTPRLSKRRPREA